MNENTRSEQPWHIWGWRALLDDNQWEAVAAWFDLAEIIRTDLGERAKSLSEFRQALRQIVPIVTIKNGMERDTRHIRPNDPPELWEGRSHLKHLAHILDEGILDHLVDGDPPAAREYWTDYRSQIEETLDGLYAEPESTDGHEDLSRKSHVRDAKTHLRNIDFATQVALSQAQDDDERVWVQELVSEIAHDAFLAGRHTQVAWGKNFEPDALIRRKSLAGFVASQAERTAYFEHRKEEHERALEHARLVRAYVLERHSHEMNANPSKAALGKLIHENWDRVGGEDRPPKPKESTVTRNWLSKNLI